MVFPRSVSVPCCAAIPCGAPPGHFLEGISVNAVWDEFVTENPFLHMVSLDQRRPAETPALAGTLAVQACRGSTAQP